MTIRSSSIRAVLVSICTVLSYSNSNRIHAFQGPLPLVTPQQQYLSLIRITTPATSSVVRLHATTETEREEGTVIAAVKSSSASKRTVSLSSVPKGKPSLGLLTFDLDDTIYPLAPVIQEANAAFARAMERYGFPNIQSNDITKRSVQIRNEIAVTDPERAATLSHTEIRQLAIRKEMELVMFHRKLQECATDWATNVDSLGPAVVTSARKYVLLFEKEINDTRGLLHIVFTQSHLFFFVLISRFSSCQIKSPPTIDGPARR
jgi:hypothetical protein